MLRVPSALELWFEVVRLNSTALGNQPRQSISEQKIELSTQRNRPIEEGAILPPEVIPRPVESLQERRSRRDSSRILRPRRVGFFPYNNSLRLRQSVDGILKKRPLCGNRSSMEARDGRIGLSWLTIDSHERLVLRVSRCWMIGLNGRITIASFTWRSSPPANPASF